VLHCYKWLQTLFNRHFPLNSVFAPICLELWSPGFHSLSNVKLIVNAWQIFNQKEQLRHSAVSSGQHGSLVDLGMAYYGVVHFSLLNLTFSALSTTSTNNICIIILTLRNLWMTLPIHLSRKRRRYEVLLLTARHHRHLRMHSRSHCCAMFTPLSCDCYALRQPSSPVLIQRQRGFWKIVSTWFRHIWRVGAKKHDHIKHLLWDRLHWLPVTQRVQFQAMSADIQGWTG